MNRVVLALFVTAFVVAGAGCATTSKDQLPDAQSLSDERSDPYKFNLSVARALLETQQATEASRIARRLIGMKPDAVEPWYLLARAHLDLRQYEAAEKALREVLRRDAELAKAHSLYGTLHDSRGDHAKAAAAHRRAIRLEPDNAVLRNNLGFSLYLAGNYRGAITAYKRALERDNGLKRVHNNLGFTYGKLGNMEKAAEQFSMAGPPAQVSNNLGVLHEERGELASAYDYYVAAARIDPQLVPARANLERTCIALGRPFPELPKENPSIRASVEPIDAEYFESLRGPVPALAPSDGESLAAPSQEANP